MAVHCPTTGAPVAQFLILKPDRRAVGWPMPEPVSKAESGGRKAERGEGVWNWKNRSLLTNKPLAAHIPENHADRG